MAARETNTRAVTYRVRPGTSGRASRLQAIVDGCRFVWNEVNREVRSANAARMLGAPVPTPSTTFFTLSSRFTSLRSEHAWLQALPFESVRYSLKRQSESWSRYLSGKGNRPRFKSRHRDGSFTIPSKVRINGDRLTIPGSRLSPGFQVRLCRRNEPKVTGEPVQAVVKRSCGRWYATVFYRVEVESPSDNGVSVGIDLNHADRAVACSTGEIISFPNTDRLEARKRRYQRRISLNRRGSMKRGSKRRRLVRRRLSKTSRKIANVRANWQHHVSRTLADTAGQVCYEDLKVKNMTRKGRGKAGLNRENLKTGWAGLREKIEYKSALPTPVSPYYTSQTCSQCGAIGIRDSESFRCRCGHRSHADVNAALNILASGSGATGRREALALATSATRQWAVRLQIPH